MTELFIDVSHHDWDRRGRALDWQAIAAAGLGTVMCARASYGDPVVFNPASPRFGEYMIGAKVAGYTCRGAYHDLIRGDQASVNRQVDLLRSAMDRYGTEWAMADVEAYGELVTRGLVPDWPTVQRFHDRWYAVDGRRMAWYIGRGFWSGSLGSPSLTGLRGALIGPRYPGVTGAPTLAYANAGGNTGVGWAAYGGRTPDIWQFSSTVTAIGASSKTDVNAYRGTRAALVALLTGGTVPSGGTSEMIFWRVNETFACGVSNGPQRYGFADMADLTEAMAAYPGSVLRHIPEARLGAYGVDVGVPTEFALTDEQLARLDFGPDDMAAVEASVTRGVMATMPSVVDAIVARLPADAMTRDEVEAAVRDAFSGGLAPDTTP